MNTVRLLIDIGSTFTKVVAINLETETIVAQAKSPTTVDTDITVGVVNVLDSLDKFVEGWKGKTILACSSAAGGLRMVSIGLVRELSVEAAKRAALGAGAKIVGNYSYQLTLKEVREIENIRPDIILLAGGTDGGNERTILHNAALLSKSSISAPVVVAGNKCAYDEIENVFKAASLRYTLVGNVMPEIGRLEVDDCREAIRKVFMENIVKAKGLGKARHLIGDIIMPTPAAVLNAALILSQGVNDEEGLGELVVIDIGGATTDVYSIAKGNAAGGVVMRGLPEPLAKRTVEGDLGVRHNIETLLALRGKEEVSLNEEIIAGVLAAPSRTPQNEQEMAVDIALARIAARTSFERHVGKIEVMYGPHGEMPVQTGKDLSHVTKVIGTGGPIIYSSHPSDILKGILTPSINGNLLKPKKANFYIDHYYLMYAVGLLASTEPATALRIMKKYLRRL